MVLLITSDNQKFNVDKEVIEHSGLIKNILEDVGESGQPIPLREVSASAFEKILEYCEHYRGKPLPLSKSQPLGHQVVTDINEWDQEFITSNAEIIFEIIQAANYLDIKPLLDVGCQTVANMIKAKTPAQIRECFSFGYEDEEVLIE